MATKMNPDDSLQDLVSQFQLAAAGVQTAYHSLEQELLAGPDPVWKGPIESEGLELPNLGPLHLMGSLVGGLSQATMVINQHMKIVSANEEAEKLFKLEGKTGVELVVVPRIVEKLQQLINDTESESGLEVKLIEGGSAGIFDCIYLDNPIEKGRLILLVAQDLELDHLREVEDQILKNLTGTLVHEIRTPLTSMQGFAELLMQVQDIDPKESNKLQFIKHGIDRLNLLASALGTVFREVVEPHWIKVNINEFLLETVSQILESHSIDGTVMEVSLLENDIQIVTDPELVREAIGRVLENSIEAIENPSPGSLSLIAKQDASELEIILADKGAGPENSELDEWWVPFYTNKSGHLGLGLVQVRRTLEILGGTATVVSATDDGVQIRLTLPL